MQSDAANVTPSPQEPALLGSGSLPPGAAAPVAIQRTEPQPSRRWLPALAVLLLLTGLGLGWRWWQGRAAGPAAAQAPAQQPQSLPVKLETLKTTTVRDYSEFIGSLQSDDAVEIRPEITGRVSRILVARGERVEAGTPLLQLSPDKQNADLASVLASVNAARATRANARSEIEAIRADRVAQAAEVELQTENFNRTSTLVGRGALSQQDLDQARRDRDTAIAQLSAIDRRIQAAQAGLAEAEAGVAQAQANADRANADLQETTVVAPFSGTVGDIPARVGDVVASSDILTSLTRNQALSLRLSIPLERAPELRTGQRVELVDNQGQVTQTGEISFIAPRVEGNAQGVLATATFSNPGGSLRDGQFVRARVVWSERPGLLVPAAAITRLAGEPFVFVAESPEAASAPTGSEVEPGGAPDPGAPAPASGAPPALVARQRQVQLGNIQGNAYQVLEGLSAGEQIVVSGVLNLADGAPIATAPPPEAAPPQP